MNSRNVIGLALALAVGAVGAATVKPSKKPSNTTTAQASPETGPLYATAPFDTAAESLPPGYAGHDCRAVARGLSSLHPVKDEYETTAAYAERSAAFASVAIVGTVTSSDFIALVQEYPSVTTVYDADAGALQIKGFALTHLANIKRGFAESVVVKSELLSQSTYPASNAYGKPVEVVKRKLYGCVVALPQIGRTTRLRDFNATVPMTPDEARKAKGNVGVLYIGKPAEPYRVDYSDYSQPTIDAPTEAYWSGDTLVVRSAEVWLFDKVTGRVYQKTKL